jgi:hypothetical protein
VTARSPARICAAMRLPAARSTSSGRGEGAGEAEAIEEAEAEGDEAAPREGGAAAATAPPAAEVPAEAAKPVTEPRGSRASSTEWLSARATVTELARLQYTWPAASRRPGSRANDSTQRLVRST